MRRGASSLTGEMAPPPTLWITALTAEARPLARALRLRRDRSVPRGICWRGRGEAGAIVLAAVGIGRRRAGEVAAELIDHLEPGEVMVLGFAGACDPALRVGDLVRPAEVTAEATGAVHRPTVGEGLEGRLLTVDRIVGGAAEKGRLRREWGADAVDMETAAVAEVCGQRGVGWGCVRAISDGAGTALPERAVRWTRGDGGVDVAAVVGEVVRRPGSWVELCRMARAGRIAAGALQRWGLSNREVGRSPHTR